PSVAELCAAQSKKTRQSHRAGKRSDFWEHRLVASLGPLTVCASQSQDCLGAGQEERVAPAPRKELHQRICLASVNFEAQGKFAVGFDKSRLGRLADSRRGLSGDSNGSGS